MSRILTGVQSTGTPHLGNLLGAIIPAIEMANDPTNESFLFIADMHSLTQIKDGNELRENTYANSMLSSSRTTIENFLELKNFYNRSEYYNSSAKNFSMNCIYNYVRRSR